MHCWARNLFILVVVGLWGLSLASACGRKGPLYLPEQQTQTAATPAATSAVPEPRGQSPAAPASSTKP